MTDWKDGYNVTELTGATLYVNKTDREDSFLQFSDEICKQLETEDVYDVIGVNGYKEWEQEIKEKTGNAATLEDYDAPSEPYTSAKVVWS